MPDIVKLAFQAMEDISGYFVEMKPLMIVIMNELRLAVYDSHSKDPFFVLANRLRRHVQVCESLQTERISKDFRDLQKLQASHAELSSSFAELQKDYDALNEKHLQLQRSHLEVVDKLESSIKNREIEQLASKKTILHLQVKCDESSKHIQDLNIRFERLLVSDANMQKLESAWQDVAFAFPSATNDLTVNTAVESTECSSDPGYSKDERPPLKIFQSLTDRALHFNRNTVEDLHLLRRKACTEFERVLFKGLASASEIHRTQVHLKSLESELQGSLTFHDALRGSAERGSFFPLPAMMKTGCPSGQPTLEKEEEETAGNRNTPSQNTIPLASVNPRSMSPLLTLQWCLYHAQQRLPFVLGPASSIASLHFFPDFMRHSWKALYSQDCPLTVEDSITSIHHALSTHAPRFLECQVWLAGYSQGGECSWLYLFLQRSLLSRYCPTNPEEFMQLLYQENRYQEVGLASYYRLFGRDGGFTSTTALSWLITAHSNCSEPRLAAFRHAMKAQNHLPSAVLVDTQVHYLAKELGAEVPKNLLRRYFSLECYVDEKQGPSSHYPVMSAHKLNYLFSFYQCLLLVQARGDLAWILSGSISAITGYEPPV